MEAMGERLGEAARAGMIFVAPDGMVSAVQPSSKHIQSPKHRFYGDQ